MWTEFLHQWEQFHARLKSVHFLYAQETRVTVPSLGQSLYFPAYHDSRFTARIFRELPNLTHCTVQSVITLVRFDENTKYKAADYAVLPSFL
jgi:hypothetical protein